MPRALAVCSTPGCPELTPSGPCRDCKRKADQRRGSGTARGWTSQWAHFSRTWLRQHPDCACTNPACHHPGSCEHPATQVDHIDGSGRTGPRAYDPANAQSLCQSCHSRKTATLDGGFGR